MAYGLWRAGKMKVWIKPLANPLKAFVLENRGRLKKIHITANSLPFLLCAIICHHHQLLLRRHFFLELGLADRAKPSPPDIWCWRHSGRIADCIPNCPENYIPTISHSRLLILGLKPLSESKVLALAAADFSPTSLLSVIAVSHRSLTSPCRQV